MLLSYVGRKTVRTVERTERSRHDCDILFDTVKEVYLAQHPEELDRRGSAGGSPPVMDPGHHFESEIRGFVLFPLRPRLRQFKDILLIPEENILPAGSFLAFP